MTSTTPHELPSDDIKLIPTQAFSLPSPTKSNQENAAVGTTTITLRSASRGVITNARSSNSSDEIVLTIANNEPLQTALALYARETGRKVQNLRLASRWGVFTGLDSLTMEQLQVPKGKRPRFRVVDVAKAVLELDDGILRAAM